MKPSALRKETATLDTNKESEILLIKKHKKVSNKLSTYDDGSNSGENVIN